MFFSLRRVPKDDHPRGENLGTQPFAEHPVFNNPEVMTEGWYPVCRARALRRGETRSFVLGGQRLALFRGEDGKVRALDAFCPHMGADLGNGRVVGNELRCYFHQWQFDGAGQLTRIRAREPKPDNVCLRAYPVEERYGHLWVYAAREAPHPVPTAPGLEDVPVDAWYLGKATLFAHHHVMMAGGIDLQHFATVHDVDIDFELEVTSHGRTVADWNLSGTLPSSGWRARLGRWLLGPRVGYRARFSGGSVASITYGREPRLFGTGRRLPTLHLLWGCVPLDSGVSQVDIFVLTPRRPGLWGFFASCALFALTALLLGVLKDDDVRAFPHMRFHPAHLIKADRSVGRFMGFINGLPLSAWPGRRATASRRGLASPTLSAHRPEQ